MPTPRPLKSSLAVEDPHIPGKGNLYRRYKDTPPEKRVIGRGQFRGQLGGLALQATSQEPTDENARALWRSAQRGGCIGSPDYIRENLRQYEEANLDVMVLIAQAGDRKHNDIVKSLKLFAKEVMPEFKERHKAHQKWRQEQLQGVPYLVNSSI